MVAKNKTTRATSEEEEAATVIQKHYKGYQVRRAQGSVKLGKLNANNRKLMKMYCNKWKGKSIFQVVLMDRANKLQDLVYFSLQVHFYNQHVISSVKNANNQPVMLTKLMSTTNVNEFMGPKKCHLYKLPFKLNRMNSIDLKRMTDGSMKDSMDDCNWDSPLSRLPEARTTFKILKHSFAVRDQGVQANIGEGVRFSDTTYYEKPKQDYEREYEEFEELPPRQRVTDNRYSAKSRPEPKTAPVVNTPKPTTKPVNKSNPVHELQLKSKQYQSANADEDDPPYNFQAFLKKTNYHRPSMDGRSVQYSSDMSYDRQDVAPNRPKDYGQPVANNVKRSSKDYKNELNQQLSKATRTELLPGIMIEGSSYDL